MATPTQLASSVPRLWHTVDARNQVIGRLAPQIARLLCGKHKPTWQPHVDGGDWVVVVNAGAAVFTGGKMASKLYHWHTQYPGGLRTLTARQLHARAPEALLQTAVAGMLPRNALRAARLRRLRVAAGGEHAHARQTAASAAYAPAHLAAAAPKSFMPPPKAATGALVADVYGALRGEALRAAEAAAPLRATDPADALRELEAELARAESAAAAPGSKRAAGAAAVAKRLA